LSTSVFAISSDTPTQAAPMVNISRLIGDHSAGAVAKLDREVAQLVTRLADAVFERAVVEVHQIVHIAMQARIAEK